MLKKIKGLLFSTGFLSLFLTAILLASTLPSIPKAEAAEGTQFNVGNLIDENFYYTVGNYSGHTEYNKLSGWEVHMPNSRVFNWNFFNIVKIKMKNSTTGTQARLFFTTYDDPAFDQTKSKAFTITASDPGYTTYTIDMDGVRGWGIIKQLRIDPVDDGTSSGTFSVDSISINNYTYSTYYLQDFTGSSGWNSAGITGLTESGTTISGTIANNDPQIVSPDLGITPPVSFDIADDQTTDKVSIKKRFVNQTSGIITLNTRFELPVKINNEVWQLNSGTTAAVKILTSGGNLAYENSSGTVVSLQSYNAKTRYNITAVVNITANTYDIYINGVLKASAVAFRNSVSNLNYVSFNTGTAETGDIYLSPIRVYKGYDIHEDFEDGILPGAWTTGGTGGTVSVQPYRGTGLFTEIYSLKMDDTSAVNNTTLSRSFTAKSSVYVLDYYFYLANKVDGASAEIKSGSTTAVKITTNSGNISYENSSGVNVTLWSNYKANCFYLIKVIVDPSLNKAYIYVNGKLEANNVPFRNAVSSIDNIKFSTPTTGTTQMWLDDIELYPYQGLAADYVPTPTPAAPTGGKIVGLQSFSGWESGMHAGWDWPYRFPQHDLEMGTFDEENPESMDWQLKFMAEHGITFFMDTYFSPLAHGTAAIKNGTWGYENINQAYYYAQYSGYVKFAIMDADGNYTTSYWENSVVPNMIENYLKDSRYMTIGGRPLISIFNPDNLRTNFGNGTLATPAATKVELDYLRNQVIAAGLGNPIIMACYWGTITAANMTAWNSSGFDYAYDYNYTMSNLTTMETMMNDSYTNRAGLTIDYVPTISVGYSNEAIDGTYNGYLSVTDFQTENNWVKNTFETGKSAGSLSSNMVFLDNWDEYAEGHWINPGALGGFGYLDAVRTTWAGGGTHTDTVPTAAQKMRINRNFPKAWIGHSWNFDSPYSDTEGWTGNANVSSLATNGGYMNLTVTGTDPQLFSLDNQGIKLASNRYVKVTFKNGTTSTQGQIYFITNSDTTWNEAKSKIFTINANDANYTQYTIDMSTVTGWTGTLKQLRLDPENGVASGTESIDSILVTDEP